MSPLHSVPTYCPGPLQVCDTARLLLDSGQAAHHPPVRCVLCFGWTSTARWSVDARAGIPGHLCPRCDPFVTWLEHRAPRRVHP
jgi:hypothetical protein